MNVIVTSAFYLLQLNQQSQENEKTMLQRVFHMIGPKQPPPGETINHNKQDKLNLISMITLCVCIYL